MADGWRGSSTHRGVRERRGEAVGRPRHPRPRRTTETAPVPTGRGRVASPRWAEAGGRRATRRLRKRNALRRRGCAYSGGEWHASGRGSRGRGGGLCTAWWPPLRVPASGAARGVAAPALPRGPSPPPALTPSPAATIQGPGANRGPGAPFGAAAGCGGGAAAELLPLSLRCSLWMNFAWCTPAGGCLGWRWPQHRPHRRWRRLELGLWRARRWPVGSRRRSEPAAAQEGGGVGWAARRRCVGWKVPQHRHHRRRRRLELGQWSRRPVGPR